MQSPASISETFFRIDAKDTICDVGGAWDDFALKNQGPRALSGRVLGSNLFEHIAGDISRMYVRSIFSAVRILGRPATRPYRCDSPQQKRLMEMTVTLESTGTLFVQHQIVKVEDFVRPITFVPGSHRISETRVRCSMCNRLKLGGEWQDPDYVLKEDIAMPIAVVYGVCPTCIAGIRGYEPTR